MLTQDEAQKITKKVLGMSSYGVAHAWAIQQENTFTGWTRGNQSPLGFQPNGLVGVFPSDHHYSDEANFTAGIDLAFEAAETNRDSVILLAAPATHPETE